MKQVGQTLTQPVPDRRLVRCTIPRKKLLAPIRKGAIIVGKPQNRIEDIHPLVVAGLAVTQNGRQRQTNRETERRKSAVST